MMEAKRRLSQLYDGKATIRQTLPLGSAARGGFERSALDVNNGGEAAD
jgi:hypothetical protein